RLRWGSQFRLSNICSTVKREWSGREPTAHAGRSESSERTRRGVGLLALGPTLEAGALQHLAVLLLTHALAALLDQRSHEGVHASGPMPVRANPHERGGTVVVAIAGSSIGRTPDFGSGGWRF